MGSGASWFGFGPVRTDRRFSKPDVGVIGIDAQKGFGHHPFEAPGSFLGVGLGDRKDNLIMYA